MKRIFGFIMCVVLAGTLYGCMSGESKYEELQREIEKCKRRLEEDINLEDINRDIEMRRLERERLRLLEEEMKLKY